MAAGADGTELQMSRRKRVDANQALIVQTLRDIGASVEPLHFVGRGFPDVLVGFRGTNYLLEIKDGSKPPSRRKLTDDEKQWHQCWAGQVCIVNNDREALIAIGAMTE